MPFSRYIGTNHERRLWFVLCLFVAAVLLPTAAVLWLLNDSISKQRQIASQQLADAYRSQLKLVSDRLREYWQNEASTLSSGFSARGSNLQNWAAWAQAIRSKSADSLVLYNENGQIIYPFQSAPPPMEQLGPDWLKARMLEDRTFNPDALAASNAYRDIASAAKDPQLVARALQAQARTLRQSGDKSRAASLIFDRFLKPGLDLAIDAQGRLISGDVLLMAIQISSISDARRPRAIERIRGLLNDYDNNPMPSPQRLFLMKEMVALRPSTATAEFPTLDAEGLALQFLETGAGRAFDSVLRPAGMKDVWVLGASGGTVTALLRTTTLKGRVERFLAEQTLPSSVQLVLVERGAAAPTAVETIPVGDYLPEWRVALVSQGPQPFDELASKQMGLYVWIGALMLTTVLAVAFVTGRAIHRQMRLANLKTDLVATVSHELKTPLASIRLLLDTLLESEELEPRRTREYLELMERENTRLTQMIENFLAFSRLERNRYSFRFDEVQAAEVVDRAMDAFAERAAESTVTLKVDVDPDLPPINADPGALSTVLLNLLDNAYKYTPDEKRIALRAFQNNGHVCFEVEDNGIGIAKSETSKVFRDFYQIDSRLARAQGGCGLGLSIVKFIVKAHRGTVSLDSRTGEGARFRVALPHSRS